MEYICTLLARDSRPRELLLTECRQQSEQGENGYVLYILGEVSGSASSRQFTIAALLRCGACRRAASPATGCRKAGATALFKLFLKFCCSPFVHPSEKKKKVAPLRLRIPSQVLRQKLKWICVMMYAKCAYIEAPMYGLFEKKVAKNTTD
jgi:hypothetical protein